MYISSLSLYLVVTTTRFVVLVKFHGLPILFLSSYPFRVGAYLCCQRTSEVDWTVVVWAVLRIAVLLSVCFGVLSDTGMVLFAFSC